MIAKNAPPFLLGRRRTRSDPPDPCWSALPALRDLRRAPFSAEKLRSTAPLTVALVLLVIGIVWTSTTEELIHRFIDEPRTFVRLETAKAWTFIAIVALSSYATTARSLRRLDRSEATIRAILRSIADGVLLVGGTDHSILDANAAAARILGVERREDLIGMGAGEFSQKFRLSTLSGRLIHPEDYRSQRILQGDRGAAYRATIHPYASDEPLSRPLTTVDITAAPVTLSPGDPPVLAVSVMRDVTEEENFEQMRDRFFSAAAHALMTPLTILKAHAQLLSRSEGDPELERRHGVAIDRQCARMDQTVKNLLVLARLRGSRLDLHMHELDLGRLLDGVVREMRHRTRTTIDARIERHVMVFGDRERLTLALQNALVAVLRVSWAEGVVNVRMEKIDHKVCIAIEAPKPAHDSNVALEDEIEVALHVSRELIDAHAGKMELRLSEAVPNVAIELPSADDSGEDGGVDA